MVGWPSRRASTAAAVAFAAVAAVVAGVARPVLFDLPAEDHARSVRRFAGGARDVEVDPQPRWARIPRILPGPADAWAGGTAHALRLLLGQRPARGLVLYLYADEPADGIPRRLTVAANDTPVKTVETRPPAGSPPPTPGGGVHSRHKVKIPSTALRDGADLRLSIINEAGASVTWERIRLVEATPRFAWGHLLRRGRFPPGSAIFLAASVGALLVGSLGGRTEVSWGRRALGAGGPGLALVLLGAALVLLRDSPVATDIPRWMWLAVPWVLFLVRARSRRLGPAAARPAPLRRAKALLLNATLAIVTLAVSLLMAELAVRFVFRDVKSAADARAYFNAPHDPLNSLGFREREFDRRKPTNVYRLAVVGDSITFAGGVPTADRFSNRLERALNEKRRGQVAYEVLNFGRHGWDTVDHVRALRTLVLGVEPDFVLLQWYVNDFENHRHAGRPQPRPLVPSTALHVALLHSSALYSLLDPQWRALQETLGLVESHVAYMERRFGDPDGPGSVYAMERLREFIAECRRISTPLGIILFPRVGPDLPAGRYPYGYLHDRVLQACRQAQVTCVDLRSTFAADADYTQLWVSLLDGHPSPLANRLAADRLMDTFGELWLAAERRR